LSGLPMSLPPSPVTGQVLLSGAQPCQVQERPETSALVRPNHSSSHHPPGNCEPSPLAVMSWRATRKLPDSSFFHHSSRHSKLWPPELKALLFVCPSLLLSAR